MTTLQLVLLIYFGIGFIVGIPLGRRYWRLFRESNHKLNIILPKANKIDFNRIIDSFVFLCAWFIYIGLYPIGLLEIVLKKESKI
ncbi:MAG: hypothetical protein M0R03_17100 [Novosphingobium sp.]|nr:hypothetical protein [Novosphingobium sp.]